MTSSQSSHDNSSKKNFYRSREFFVEMVYPVLFIPFQKILPCDTIVNMTQNLNPVNDLLVNQFKSQLKIGRHKKNRSAAKELL